MALNGCAATLASDPTRHELHQCLVPFPHDATGGMFPPLVSHLSTLTLDRDGQLAFLLSSALRLLYFILLLLISFSFFTPPGCFFFPSPTCTFRVRTWHLHSFLPRIMTPSTSIRFISCSSSFPFISRSPLVLELEPKLLRGWHIRKPCNKAFATNARPLSSKRFQKSVWLRVRKKKKQTRLSNFCRHVVHRRLIEAVVGIWYDGVDN